MVKVEEALRFIEAIGVDTTAPQFTSTDFYVAHECLLLQYVLPPRSAPCPTPTPPRPLR